MTHAQVAASVVADAVSDDFVSQDLYHSALSEEQRDERALLARQICDRRRESVSFVVPLKASGTASIYSSGGPLTSVLQRSRFATHANTAVGAKEDRVGVFLISADLLPTMFTAGTKEGRDFEALPEPSSEFFALLEWVKLMRRSGDTILAFDGRSRKIRITLNKYFDELGDETRLGEGMIAYAFPQAGDPRFQKRKVAWSANNREFFFVHFPTAKVSVKAAQRSSFQLGAGDDSTHETTYVGVPVRSLDEIPRLSFEDKSQVAGASYAPSHPPKLTELIGQRGVPLCWAECKPVALMSTLFIDLRATHIFDLGAGSGSAAIGAYMNGLSYEGVCANEAHKTWLDRIMDSAAFALVSEGNKQRNPVDKQTAAKIKHYFTGPIAEGQRCLRQQNPKKLSEGQVLLPEDY